VILSELAERLGCELRGDGAVEVRGVAGIEEAGPGDLTFLANRRYAAHLAASKAAAVILAPGQETKLPSLLSDNPYLTFARAVSLLCPPARPAPGVDRSACVDPTADFGPDVHVGALAVVGPRTRVGARSVIHPHVVLGEGVEIGDDCILHSGVQVREGCRLGHRVIVQNGAVVGADGFGFPRDRDGHYHKFPQVGIVVVEDDVEIGALTAIDRAALGETRIARGCKLDNLVQIGHSVTVGEDTVLAGQVGIAGSVSVGRQVTLAGQVGVAGHLRIGDGVIATAKTGIPSSVEDGKLVSGYPAIDNRGWLRSSAVFAKLPELQRRVRELERRIKALTDGIGD
jgi:UDP-3-O-[3-hydroxymyristoyl] glucosamine N-acyltransferase